MASYFILNYPSAQCLVPLLAESHPLLAYHFDSIALFPHTLGFLLPLMVHFLVSSHTHTQTQTHHNFKSKFHI